MPGSAADQRFSSYRSADDFSQLFSPASPPLM